METNYDGSEEEQIFYDTVREYVVRIQSFILCYRNILHTHKKLTGEHNKIKRIKSITDMHLTLMRLFIVPCPAKKLLRALTDLISALSIGRLSTSLAFLDKLKLRRATFSHIRVIII